MFLDVKLENKLSEYDCIAFDGGYYYYVENFIENVIKKEILILLVVIWCIKLQKNLMKN